MKLSRNWIVVLASAGAATLGAVAVVAGLAIVGDAKAAATAVPLGTAGSFSVLGGAGISNTGPTSVSGDIGTFPTTTINGLGSLTVGGANHAGDAVTQQAKNDLVTAYDTAAGEGPTNPIAADLSGRTLLPGVYNSASSIGLSGALTLNAQGNPNSVFVFQAGSTLTTASGSRISLINGAQACNVFWKIGSSATLGTGSTFLGNIIALTSITVTTGVTVDGRVLARNGAVTLDTDTITTSGCTTTSGTTAPGTTVPGTTTPGATTPTSTTPGTTTPGTTTPGTSTPAQKKLAAKKRAVAKRKAAAKKKQIIKTKRLIHRVTAPKPPTHRYGLTG